MTDMVERIARTFFTLNGKSVGKGQIVTLTQTQLANLAKAECVYEDDARNAEVPVAEMPATQGSATAQSQTVQPASGDLDKMTKAELEQLAADRDVDISAAKTKADIVAALQAADQQ